MQMTTDDVEGAGARWRALFEERHGTGAYPRLIADLQQPCTTFAAIAKRLGVTRELVRQWQLRLLPDAPRGHERQRLCAAYRQKRAMLRDPLFRSFYRHARSCVESGRVELVKASDGYRRRLVRIGHHLIVLLAARASSDPASAANLTRYRLVTYRGTANFAYVRLTADDYLLMPADGLRARDARRLVDASGAPFGRFKNTFAALDAADTKPASIVECRCP